MQIFWNKPARPAKQAGFTLLELLVVIAIISLMTAVVGFSVSGNSQRSLKGEGDKLAARLNAAHAQMNAGASPLRLVVTPQGYAFESIERAADGSAQAQWKRVVGDDVLAARDLPTGASIKLEAPLLIAREPISAAASFTLTHDAVQIQLATDGINGWAAR
jgi:type II secretion system protein H